MALEWFLQESPLEGAYRDAKHNKLHMECVDNSFPEWLKKLTAKSTLSHEFLGFLLERSTYAAAQYARSAISNHRPMRSIHVPGSMVRIANTIYEENAGTRCVMVLRTSKGCFANAKPRNDSKLALKDIFTSQR